MLRTNQSLFNFLISSSNYFPIYINKVYQPIAEIISTGSIETRLKLEEINMFNKILVAIDRSTAGRKVFEAAMSLAKTSGANLMLLHVLSSDEQDFPTPTIYSGLEYDPFDSTLIEAYQERWQKFEQEGLEMLRGTAEEATRAGIKAEFTQNLGNPGRTIGDVAQSWSADLIVVGSRGRTGIKEMFLGSVSNYVTHHAPCSVLIVHQPDNLDSQLLESEQQELTSSAA